MAGYRLTGEASADLVAIYVTGYDRFGPAQADAYHDRLMARFTLIAEYPRLARLRREIEPPVRAVPFKAHLIIYDLMTDGSVVILRVRHGHEDWINPA